MIWIAMEIDRSPADFAFRDTQEPLMGSTTQVLEVKINFDTYELGLEYLRHGHETEIAAASIMNLSVPFFDSMRVWLAIYKSISNRSADEIGEVSLTLKAQKIKSPEVTTKPRTRTRSLQMC